MKQQSLNEDTPVLLKISNAVARIRLHRPHHGNALTREMLDLLNHALSVVGDPSVRVVVISGSGDSFCTGSDVEEVTDEHGRVDKEKLLSFVHEIRSTVERLARIQKPVIASVHGYVLASGLEIMMACDLVIADRSARIGEGHANYGLLPGAGGTVRLARIAGPLIAKYLAYTGRTMLASDLVRFGLVNDAVAQDQLDSHVDELADLLATRSLDGLAHMKCAIDNGLDGPLRTALAVERVGLEEHVHSADVQEGILALSENRKPQFFRVESDRS